MLDHGRLLRMKERRELWPQGILCCPLGCDAASWEDLARASGSHSRVASWAAEEALCVVKLCKFEELAGVLLSKGPSGTADVPLGMGEDDGYIWVPGQ